MGTYLTETLIDEHINDVDPKQFIGTISVDEPDNPIPKPCTEYYKVPVICQEPSMNTLTRMVKQSDCIIYNMDECCPDELEFILKVLKYS